MATRVPRRGRARSTRSGREYDRMGREKALDPVRHVATREGGSGDVLDVRGQLERGSDPLAEKLGPPRGLADLVAVGFPILEDLHSGDRAVPVEGEREGDELVLADHLVHD